MTKKNKILVLSCQGGGGHMSAAAAIKQYLPDYDIEIIDLIGVSLVPLDPFYKITKKYSGQDLYNFLLQKNYKRCANFFFLLGKFLIYFQKTWLSHAVTQEIKKYNPAIVISVIPLINDLIITSCAQLGLSCIIVPTDFDVTTFLYNVPSVIDHGNVTICLNNIFPEVITTIDASLKRKVINTGFPIRASFFVKKDKEALKALYGIAPDKPILLLVMGATGSAATLDYLQQLRHVTFPLHIIICVGRGVFLYPLIEKIAFASHISITIVDHTADIADMMAVADVCITKPGSVTFAEIMYMNLPILIDQTTTALLWERLNITLVRHYKLGDVIINYHDIVPLVTAYLTNTAKREQAQSALRAIPKEYFGDHISAIVAKNIQRHCSIVNNNTSDRNNIY